MSETDYTKNTFPININGLSGRYLMLPAKKNKKREILIIPGHHTSIERMAGVADYVSNYGQVTLPDLPGFGGMDSFYTIGKHATLDDFADYLASFIKLRYKNRRFTIAGLSLGFVVVTRMLQKYPDIAKRVDILISLAGFTHKDDFKWKKRTIITFKIASRLLSMRLPAFIAQKLILQGPCIRLGYKIIEGKLEKLRDTNKEERKQRIDFEVNLWKINDLRTQMATSVFMFKMDLTKQHIKLPVLHLAADEDRYFDQLKTEQHMRKIFTNFTSLKPDDKFHGPTVVAKAHEVERFVPKQLKKILNAKTV